jgi:hypothetical protein
MKIVINNEQVMVTFQDNAEINETIHSVNIQGAYWKVSEQTLRDLYKILNYMFSETRR